VVGRVTSGNHGFRVGQTLALAMVRPDCAAPGTALSLDILGTRHDAVVVEESPYDPENARLRA
jgi:dimethylglycine dehydrogenase